MTEIKPCSGCGGKAELFANRGGNYVECLGCFKKTAICDTAEEAIASWNENATLLTNGPSDKGMNANPVFCCGDMAQLFASGEIHLQRLDQSGDLIVTVGRSDRYVPLNYCPSCGRLFRLTFLADRREGE